MILPPPASLHGRVHGLGHQKRAGQVGVQDVGPLLEAQLLWRLADVDARVVEQDVNAVERTPRLGNRPIDILGLCHVGGDDQRGRTGRLRRSVRTASLDFAALRPRMAIEAPAWASPRAMPSPMPPLPPVTMATLPVKSNGFAHCFPFRPSRRGRLPLTGRGH